MLYNITVRLSDGTGKSWKKEWNVDTDDYGKDKVVGDFITDEMKFDVIGRLNDRELFEQGVARQLKMNEHVDEAVDLAAEEIDTGATGDAFDEYMKKSFAPPRL